MTPDERALMRKALALDEEGASERCNSIEVLAESVDCDIAWGLSDRGLMSGKYDGIGTCTFYVTPTGRVALEDDSLNHIEELNREKQTGRESA